MPANVNESLCVAEASVDVVVDFTEAAVTDGWLQAVVGMLATRSRIAAVAPLEDVDLGNGELSYAGFTSELRTEIRH